MRSRAFATFLAIWIVSLAGLFVAQLQRATYSQGASGREHLARVRAHWAARAGLEATIARLAHATIHIDGADAFAAPRDMAEAATGTLPNATWSITHEEDGELLPGPADAHAKVHAARMTRESLLYVPFMTEDVADAILDWNDEDDDVRLLGAEAPYYQGARHAYHPRNAPMRTITELDLVAGVDPEIAHEEWGTRLTCASVDGAAWGASGDARLDLTIAPASDVSARLGVTRRQAGIIISHAQNEVAALGDFLQRPLISLQPVSDPRLPVEDLSNDQLALLLTETCIGPPLPSPGKVNINTAGRDVLESVPGLTLELVDAILFDRQERSEGYLSLIDLLEVPGVTPQILATLYDQLSVRSNVYVVDVQGRDIATGLEVHLIGVIDRSRLPIAIRELSIR